MITHQKVLPTGEVVHDFRPQKLGWGWNGLMFTRVNDKVAEMQGVGKGIKTGHFIALHQAGVDYAYQVNEINYESNPPDMFYAKLRIYAEFEDGELDD